MTASVTAGVVSKHATLVAVRLGFSTGLRRLRSREALLTTILALSLSFAAGIIERRVTTAGAVDRSLAATFRAVLPLFCFALAARVSDRDSLREAAWPVARYGAARHEVALGMTLALGLVTSIAGAVLAAASVLTACSKASAPLGRDLFTSSWIGALVGAAYAGWFVFGGTFFARGRGRWIPLVFDFVMGSGTGLIAAMLPRAHARGLLGAEGPLGISQPTSSVLLLLMAVVLGSLAALRCRE